MEKSNITPEELEKIRRYARKDIEPDELYTFPLILCDNEIDRDGEKFTAESLEKLAELFVGKTGIFDHRMSSKNQTARIYSAAVETDESRRTADGEPYTCVRAMAYMLRSEKNSDLIAEIEAGIKKETSVGCSVRSIRCSICGSDIKKGACGHRKGEVYDGKTCCHLLCEPEDAYEWSFVAVPSQKNAGVTKSYGGQRESGVKELADEIRAQLTKDALASLSAVLPGMDSELAIKICDALPLSGLRDFALTLSLGKSRVSPAVRQLEVKAADPAPDNSIYLI